MTNSYKVKIVNIDSTTTSISFNVPYIDQVLLYIGRTALCYIKVIMSAGNLTTEKLKIYGSDYAISKVSNTNNKITLTLSDEWERPIIIGRIQ